MRVLCRRLHRPDSHASQRPLSGVVALAVLAALVARVGAQTPLINFDDVADGSAVNTRYLALGVRLGCLKGKAGRCTNDARAAAAPNYRGGPAYSSPNILTVAAGTSAYAPAFNEEDGYALVHFLSPVSQVSVYAQAYQPVAGTTRNGPFMQAFGTNNQWLATVDYPSAGSSNWQPLVISRSSRDIQYVLLSAYRDRGSRAVYGLFDNLSYAPMPLPQWQALAAGTSYSLGLKTDGSLWAWGRNQRGQLGSGSTAASDHVQKVGGNDWLAAAAGAAHVAAVQRDGTLWTWGSNDAGQLGDGGTRDRLSPARIGTFSNWTAVAAGADHTLGVRREPAMPFDIDTLWTWGGNASGQLGDGGLTSHNLPVQVGLVQPRALGGGDAFSVASTVASRAGPNETLQTSAWGTNTYGQLGDGSTASRNTPGALPSYAGAPPSAFAQVAVGSGHVAAITAGGELWTWGLNSRGQLGNGNTTDQHQPTQVPGSWQVVAAGNQHTVAIQADGSLWAWGWNSNGQLGDGSTADRAVPTRIGSDRTWTTAAAGTTHTLAARSDGTLWAWGQNDDGQLGNRSAARQTTPQRSGLLRVTTTAQTHGRISPAGPQAVDYLASQAFTVTADRGYTATVVGCGGALRGIVYATAPITADCSVTARFAGPRANLVVATFSLPDTSKAGGRINVRTTVVNNGTLAAPASTTCVSYALAAAPLARPQNLACRPAPALAVSASFTDSYVALLPLRLPTGTYTISVRADANGQVDEDNEQDNTAQATLKITP